MQLLGRKKIKTHPYLFTTSKRTPIFKNSQNQLIIRSNKTFGYSVKKEKYKAYFERIYNSKSTCFLREGYISAIP